MSIILRLQDFIPEVLPIKNTFEKLKSKRNEIINATTAFSNGLPGINTENYYVSKDDPMPIIFKFDKLIKPIRYYELKHLRNSIIKSILIIETIPMVDRINMLNYLLYYYWFYRANKYEEISTNVIVDLEIIIRTIISKELTLYRKIDTAAILYALDWKFREEKMIKSAFNLNLRR